MLLDDLLRQLQRAPDGTPVPPSAPADPMAAQRMAEAQAALPKDHPMHRDLADEEIRSAIAAGDYQFKPNPNPPKQDYTGNVIPLSLSANGKYSMSVPGIVPGVAGSFKDMATLPRDVMNGDEPMWALNDAGDLTTAPNVSKRAFNFAMTTPLAGAVPLSLAGGIERGALAMNAPTKIATETATRPRLVPALRRGDEVLHGEPGQIHADVALKHDYFPTSRDDEGFVVEGGGPWMSRADALDFARANEPGTAANLTKARMGKLEATDLRRAREIDEGTYPTSPPLKGMPLAANVPGFGSLAVGPNATARAAAENYMKSRGMPFNPQREYVPVDPDRAARVAQEFEKMPHAPNDPEVATSYKALIDETKAQFDAMPKDLKIEFIKPDMKDPYAASPRLVQKDIAENNHMWVYPTESGFGKEGFDPKGNPMLEKSGVSVDGRELANNDLFRIVHDYFGHAKEGVGFRATGEDNAFRQHRAMFSPAAQRALTTETRGQNSWLNYGPQGEKNRTAKTEDTTFADQKVGLMPQWTTLYANSKQAAPLSLAAAASDFPFDNPNAVLGKAVDDPMGPVYGKQTVRDPIRNSFPGIYDDPRKIAADAAKNVEPESPWLKRLFGVTRDDLYEMSQQGRRKGNIDDFLIPQTGRSKLAQQVTTPENAQRLVDILSEVEKASPEMVRGMDPWYVMDPAFKRLVELVGPEEATKRFNDLNAYTSMMSPGSQVTTEINRGTAANYLANQGRFAELGPLINSGGSVRGAARDLADLEGHIYGKTSHMPGLTRYNETGNLTYSPDIVKVPLYYRASGVPETGFQTRHAVPDAHFTRGLGIPDVRTAETQEVQNSAMKRGIYAPTGKWYRENVSDALGIEAVPAQARQWGTLAHITGVKTKVGAPKLELLARNIGERAERRALDPEKLRDKVLMGQSFAVNPAELAPFSLMWGSQQN